MAIRDWKVWRGTARNGGPIGEPQCANRQYMVVFSVLEGITFMQLTDAELRRHSKRGGIVGERADEERARRWALEE